MVDRLAGNRRRDRAALARAEAAWAVAGAVALLVSGLLTWRAAAFAVGEGTDIYLFLTGMMLLSELARREGLFDYLAALAVRRAAGSPGVFSCWRT